MKIWGAPISHGLCLLGWEALHGVQVQRFRAQPATEPLRRTLVLRTQRANREGPVAPPVFVMTRCHGPPGPRGPGSGVRAGWCARGPPSVVRRKGDSSILPRPAARQGSTRPTPVLQLPMVTLSVLDLATVATGSTPAQALAETTRLAAVVEELGYHRMWVAEHHGMPAVASSAPAVVIAHLANATSTLRVGSGGVMLPNHSPLVVAEQFGTLEALHPGRIDLGLGRAPGTDQVTARALRRGQSLGADGFPDDVVELVSYLATGDGPPTHPSPTPGRGYLPEVWLLGSSLFSAQLAGQLGLPYSFAYHFAPGLIDQALETYRSSFRPSFLLGQPRAMVAVSVICASTDAEAAWLSGSSALSILQLRSGRLGLLPSPEEAGAYEFSPAELAIVEEVMSTHVIGSPETVHDGLSRLLLRTDADEIMLSTRVHSYEARVQSLSLVAGTWGLERPSRLVG
jgi:luciferase family oxidoreductase group 1